MGPCIVIICLSNSN